MSIVGYTNATGGSVTALIPLYTIGVFVALDLFLFYFFWEATLIPMALLIGMYGHGRKVYAAVKFFMYTMIASVFMLAAIIWLYAQTHSFDFVTIRDAIANHQVTNFPAAAQWLFLGFFIAFAVKVPLFPFHTWLPDAHVEAPTAGSVLLAGVLLKMGTYGMLRFNLGLFPEQSRHNAPWIAVLALIGVYVPLTGAGPSIARAVFWSGVFAEGWAVYVTQVMMDVGYGADDPALMLVHLKFYLRSVINAMIAALHGPLNGGGLLCRG